MYAVTIATDGGFEGAIVEPTEAIVAIKIAEFIEELTAEFSCEVAGDSEFGWVIVSPCPDHGAHEMIVSPIVEVQPIGSLVPDGAADQAWLN